MDGPVVILNQEGQIGGDELTIFAEQNLDMTASSRDFAAGDESGEKVAAGSKAKFTMPKIQSSSMSFLV